MPNAAKHRGVIDNHDVYPVVPVLLSAVKKSSREDRVKGVGTCVDGVAF